MLVFGFIAICIFCFGCCIGSFLNVVIFRLAPGSSQKWWKERSKCPHCKHALGFFDLIPLINFAILRGKCRYCRKSIDIQYPLVELCAGFLFLAAFIHIYGLAGESIFFMSCSKAIELLRDWFFICICIIVFVFDLRYMLILDSVILPAAALSFCLNIATHFSFIESLIGGALGFIFFALQFYISRGKWVGGGDMKLGLFIGLALGWQSLIVALFFAYWAGALGAIVLIMNKKKRWGDKIPFGTFLTASMIFALFFAKAIIFWYCGLFL